MRKPLKFASDSDREEEESDLFSSDDSLLDPSVKPGQLSSTDGEYDSDTLASCSKVPGLDAFTFEPPVETPLPAPAMLRTIKVRTDLLAGSDLFESNNFMETDVTLSEETDAAVKNVEQVEENVTANTEPSVSNILEDSIDVGDENEIDEITLNEMHDDDIPEETVADTFTCSDSFQ